MGRVREAIAPFEALYATKEKSAMGIDRDGEKLLTLSWLPIKGRRGCHHYDDASLTILSNGICLGHVW